MPLPIGALPDLPPLTEQQKLADQPKAEPGLMDEKELVPLASNPDTQVMALVPPLVTASAKFVDYTPYMTAFERLAGRMGTALSFFAGEQPRARVLGQMAGVERLAEAEGKSPRAAVAAYRGDMAEAESALLDVSTEIGKRGIQFKGNVWELRESANRLLAGLGGRAKVMHSPEDWGKIEQAAMVTALVNDAVLDPAVRDRYLGVKWDKIKSSFKVVTPEMTPQQLENDMWVLEDWVANGGRGIDHNMPGGSHLGLTGRDQEATAQRYISYLTGKPYPQGGLPDEEKLAIVNGLVGTHKYWDQRLDGYAKWAQLGMAMPIEEIEADGRTQPGRVPLYQGVFTKHLYMLGKQVGFNKPATAEWNERDAAVLRLESEPELYVREYFAGATQPQQQDLVDYISQARNGEDRFNRMIERATEVAYRYNAAKFYGQGGDPYVPVDTAPPLDLLAMWRAKTAEKVALDVERQKNVQIPGAFTPEDQERARQFYLEHDRRARADAVSAQEAAQSNWVWNQAMKVAGAVGSVIEATGVGPLLDGVSGWAFDEMQRDRLRGKDARGIPTGVPQSFTEMFQKWYRPNQMTGEELLRDYYERKKRGEASAWEEITLLPYLVTDLASNIAGFTLDHPGTMALMGAGASKLLAARSVAGDALVRAGMPAKVVAGAELAAAPAHFMTPFRRIMNWNTEFMGAAGKTLRGVRRSLNAANPESRAKGMTVLRSVLDHGQQYYGAPESKLAALRSHVAAIEADLKTGGKVSRRTMSKFGEELRGAPGQLIQALTEPFVRGIRSTVDPRAASREAGEIVGQLQQMDDAARATGVFESLKTTPAALVVDYWQSRSLQRQASFNTFVSKYGNLIPAHVSKWLRPYYDAMVRLDDLIPHLATTSPAAIKADEALNGNFEMLVQRYGHTHQRLLNELAEARVQAGRATTAAEALRWQRVIEERSRQTPALAAEIERLQRQKKTRPSTEPGRPGRYDGYRCELSPDIQLEILNDAFYFHRFASWESTPVGALDLVEGPGLAEQYREITQQAGAPHAEALKALHAEKAVVDKAIAEYGQARAEDASHTLGIKTPARPKTAQERLDDYRAELARLPADAPASRRAELQRLVNEAYDRTAGGVVKDEIRPYLLNEWVEKEIGDRMERLNLGLDGIAQKMRVSFVQEAQRRRLLDIPALPEELRKRLDEMRSFHRWLQGQAESPHGMQVSLGAVLTSQFRALGWRALSDLDFRVETSAALDNERMLRIEAKLDRYDPLLQQRFWAHQRGEQTLLPRELETMSIELTDIRKRLLKAAHRIGRISDETYEYLKDRPYEERVYLNELEGRRLANLRADEPFAVDRQQHLLTPERFFHLRAQRSTMYARQVYFNPITQKVENEYFYVRDHKGAEGATAAAQAWREQQLKDGWLRESELGPTVEAITDRELGAMGVVDDTGLIRFSNMQKLMSEVAAYDTFGTVARMTGLARKSLDGVPKSRQGEWSKALQGRDWGPLEGMHVHRNVIHMVRSWNDLHTILGTAAEEMVAATDMARVWSKTPIWTEKMIWGNEKPSALARTLRTQLILGNIKSWFNNAVGGMWSAYWSGANPLDLEWMRDYTTGFNRWRNDVREGKVKLGHPQWEETDIMANTGSLSQTAGLGGSSSLSSAAESLKTENKRLERRLAKYEEMHEKLTENLAQGLYDDAPALLEKARKTEIDLQLVTEDIRAELVRRNVLQPTIFKALRNSIADPRKNAFWTEVGDLFGSIDSRARFATMMALRRKGLSPEAAAARVSMFFQNYAQVPAFVRQLRNRLVGGAMVPSFAFEAARITANAIQASPVRFWTSVLARPLFNIGALAASGVGMDQWAQAQGFDSQFEQMSRLFSTVLVPTGSGLLTLDTSGTDPLSVAYRPAGAFGGTISRQVVPTLERAIGPLAAVPAVLLSYASQFVGNTPMNGAVMTWATGIDTRTGEMVTDQQGDLGFFARALRPALSMVVPRTLMSASEAWTETGPTSLYTGGYNTALEKIVSKMLVGARYVTGREIVIANIIQRLHEGERAALYSAYMGEQRQLVSLSQKFNKAKTVEEWKALRDEGASIMKELSKEPLTDEEAMKRFIVWASRNPLQLIDRMPVSRLPSLLLWLSQSNYGDQAKDLTAYGFLHLVSDQYMAARDDIDDLTKAAVECGRVMEMVSDPDLKQRYRRGLEVTLSRIGTLAGQTPAPLRERLARTRLGSAPGVVRQELQRILRAGAR